MKLVIKILIVTAFVVIISWQVLSLAAKAPFDYDKYVENVERIEAKLAAASEQEVNTLLMSAEEEDKQKAKTVIAKIIREYEALEHNPEYRQQAKEEIAMLTYKTGDYEGALEKAKEVLSEYPRSLSGSTVLAMCRHFNAQKFMREKNYDLAIAEYEKILGQPVADGLNAFANYFIARTYEKKLDKHTAGEYYRKIIEDFPELEWKERAKKKLEIINDEK